MTKKIAVVFPGQGSQSVGMMAGLYQNHPVVRDTFAEANDALAFDLWSLIQDGPAETLNQTNNTQPAMLASGIAVWRLLLEQGLPAPVKMAGHSLGEYSALVAAGSLGFADAVKLVAQRGRFMQEAVPEGEGAMAAILGLDDETVIQLCDEVSGGEVAEAVNFNSPGQVVIAGNKNAIDRAMAAAREAGAKRALPLPVSAPSHCALMKPAAEQLSAVLAGIAVNMPTVPVVHNVNVEAAVSANEVTELLARQLYSPVRWVETVQGFVSDGIETVIEAGPGKVLTGLCKRIDKSLSGVAVFDDASLKSVMEQINAE